MLRSANLRTQRRGMRRSSEQGWSFARRISTGLAAVALFLLLITGLVVGDASGESPAYDPLQVEAVEIEEFDLTVMDPNRDREIPLCIHLPAGGKNLPIVLFSHGLGGSCHGNDYLAHHWAKRGFAAIFIQHPGSDESVWKDVPHMQRRQAMKKAASVENFLFRTDDVPAVLDHLEAWNMGEGHRLSGRLDPARVGMSGHSFGARTTQAVSGEVFGGGRFETAESRIQAAVALSPDSPRSGSPAQAFGGVEIPWLLMTGTKDTAAIGKATVKSRLAVFPALPPGGKYELVLEGAEHLAFSDRQIRGGRGGNANPRNPNHHRAILALSTAFWDAYLNGDAAALAWLDGHGPQTVLEPKDRWQKK